GPGVPLPRAGKVVLVDVDRRALDPFHLALPADLRARAPAEVVTVAQMHYTRQEVGRDEMGAPAIRLSSPRTVTDRASRPGTASHSFAWGEPPGSSPRAGGKEDVTGPPPLKEINSFLTGLR